MTNFVFFHAHPDDEAISTGGTMALLSDAGHRVVLVCATKGEMGEPAEGVLKPGEELGARRVIELQTSADLLGVERLEFLGYRDSGMVQEASNDDPSCFWQADLDEAAERLAVIMRSVDCDVLVGYDPHGVYGHPDHIKVHLVGARAAEMTQVDRVFWATANRTEIQAAMESGAMGDAELEDDDRVSMDEFGMPDEELTHAVDVTAAIDRKRASLAAHESQITEESFFLAMDDAMFAQAFGTEWFVDAARYADSRIRQGEMVASLFD